MRTLLLTLLLVSFSQFSYAESCETARYKDKIFDRIYIEYDIVYGSNTNNLGKEQDLHLDVFMPNTNQDTLAKRPVILLIHGGAFVEGSKNRSNIRYLAREFASRGYVAIPIQYRLQLTEEELWYPLLDFADRTDWYKTIIRCSQDIKGAIRHLKHTYASEGNPYAIDTNNITLYGSSAGAIGILHATYLDESDEISASWKRSIEQLGGFEGNTSPHLQYGSTNTVRNLLVDSGALYEKKWIGDKNDVDVMSIHHNNDYNVPFGHGCFYGVACHLGRHYGPNQFVPILEANGSRVEHNIVQGVAHPVEDNQIDLVLEKAVDFLYESQCKYTPPESNETVTSIKSKTALPLQFFPNPSQESIQLTIPDNSTHHRLQIYNTMGQLVQEQILPTGIHRIFHSLPTGLYVLHLTADDGIRHIGSMEVVR